MMLSSRNRFLVVFLTLLAVLASTVTLVNADVGDDFAEEIKSRIQVANMLEQLLGTYGKEDGIADLIKQIIENLKQGYFGSSFGIEMTQDSETNGLLRVKTIGKNLSQTSIDGVVPVLAVYDNSGEILSVSFSEVQNQIAAGSLFAFEFELALSKDYSSYEILFFSDQISANKLDFCTPSSADSSGLSNSKQVPIVESKFGVKNLTWRDGNTLVGELWNESKYPFFSLGLQVYFYNAEGKIMGSTNVLVGEQIPAGSMRLLKIRFDDWENVSRIVIME